MHDKACVKSSSNSRNNNSSIHDYNQDCSIQLSVNDDIVENKNCKVRK